ITTAKAGKTTVRVLRLDPRTVRAETTETNENLVAVFGKPLARGAHHHAREAGAPPPAEKRLYIGAHVFSIDKKPPANAIAIADVSPAPVAEARAAVGISDDDGMLQWIELGPDEAPSLATSEGMLELLK